MRKLGIIAVLALMVTALAAVPALAASPHFLRQSATIDNSGNLVVTFKEAGLGNALETATYRVTGSVTANYGCINRGSKHPEAANKEAVSTNFDSSQTFPVRNGSATGTITIPLPEATLDCPGNQVETLLDVTYFNVTLTSGASGNQIPFGQVGPRIFLVA
jgi:hypothetical protein